MANASDVQVIDVSAQTTTTVSKTTLSKNKTPSAPKSAAAASSGVGTSSSMYPPAGAPFGICVISTPVTFDLQWDLLGKSQKASARINGTFYVYHENGEGLDDYFVVYMEDGSLTPGTMLSNDGQGRGFYQVLFTNSAAPTHPDDGSPLIDGVSWSSSSPATVNQNESKQDMTVDSFSEQLSLSLSVQAGKQGSIGGSVGGSVDQTVQIWNSTNITISDWGINETTQAASNVASWTWHQQEVWDPLAQRPQDFKSWYQQAYDDNAVIALPNLSTNTLQYHATAAWRFDKSLIDSNGSLEVRFAGDQSYLFAAMSMPGFGNSQYHTLCWSQPSASWEYTLDLVDVVRQGSNG